MTGPSAGRGLEALGARAPSLPCAACGAGVDMWQAVGSCSATTEKVVEDSASETTADTEQREPLGDQVL